MKITGTIPAIEEFQEEFLDHISIPLRDERREHVGDAVLRPGKGGEISFTVYLRSFPEGEVTQEHFAASRSGFMMTYTRPDGIVMEVKNIPFSASIEDIGLMPRKGYMKPSSDEQPSPDGDHLDYQERLESP